VQIEAPPRPSVAPRFGVTAKDAAIFDRKMSPIVMLSRRIC
jgi:hypothetical protein